MMNIGGYNNRLTDFYAGEIANRPKAKEDGGVSGRSKAKEGGRVSQLMDAFESSKAQGTQKASKSSAVSSVTQTSEANEAKLSDKAKNYLKNLREANEDFDFYVANGDDEVNGALGSSGKEYAVAFSNEELEKMADNEEYAQQMLDGIGMAMDMADRVKEGLSLDDKGISFNRIDVAINDDGTLSILAELEKSANKQKEQLEAAKEERAKEKKEANEEETAATTKIGQKNAAIGMNSRRMGAYGGNDILRTKLSADSEEDLFDKVAHVDWNKISGEQRKQMEVPRFESAI